MTVLKFGNLEAQWFLYLPSGLILTNSAFFQGSKECVYVCRTILRIYGEYILNNLNRFVFQTENCKVSVRQELNF
jgi:hypothetical protein